MGAEAKISNSRQAALQLLQENTRGMGGGGGWGGSNCSPEGGSAFGNLGHKG